MIQLIQSMNSFVGRLAAKIPALCLLARFAFAAVLLIYFWASGLSKLGEGLLGVFHPSAGAYVQIFPKQMEAFGYDHSHFGLFHYLVVLMGVLAEFLFPLMIVIGLLTRYAALGMIVFIAVQTATDLFGHGVLEDPTTLGKWFDRSSSSVIMDQRLLWLFVLIYLVKHGGGVFSLDQWLSPRKV
jgi:putative oxidoreductase